MNRQLLKVIRVMRSKQCDMLESNLGPVMCSHSKRHTFTYTVINEY